MSGLKKIRWFKVEIETPIFVIFFLKLFIV